MNTIKEALEQRGYNPEEIEIDPRCPEEKVLSNGQSWCLLSDNPCFKKNYNMCPYLVNTDKGYMSPCDYYNDYLKELEEENES